MKIFGPDLNVTVYFAIEDRILSIFENHVVCRACSFQRLYNDRVCQKTVYIQFEDRILSFNTEYLTFDQNIWRIERPIISKYWRVLGGIDRSSISFKLDKNVFALQTAVNTLDIERLTTWDYDLQN